MHQISLTGDVRGATALNHLCDPQATPLEERDQFFAAASMATDVDAVTAAVLSASVREHLESDPEAKAFYSPPQEEGPRGVLYNLLGALPDRCGSPAGELVPARDRLALFPASDIESVDEAEDAALFILGIRPYVPITEPEASFLATAVVALADNGLKHAADSPCNTIVCAGLAPDETTITLAAVDLGISAQEAIKGSRVLQEAIESSTKKLGGIAGLLGLAQLKGLDISVLLATGTEEATWQQGWTYDTRQYVPGWCSAITIHRP